MIKSGLIQMSLPMTEGQGTVDEIKEAIETAQRNFLKEIVFLLYTHNRQQKAAEMFTYLKKKFPAAIPPDLPLDEYALTRLTGSLKDMTNDKAKGVIEGLIVQYYQNLVMGDEDRANGMLLMGQKMWKLYEARTVREAIRLPPFKEMMNDIRNRLLDPKEGLDPQNAARLRAAIENK